jgi:hypothetical protein
MFNVHHKAEMRSAFVQYSARTAFGRRACQSCTRLLRGVWRINQTDNM